MIKSALLFSFLLVSLHTSPLAHAGVTGSPLVQRHECPDHVHQTGDSKGTSQPKALLQNGYAIHFVIKKRLSDEGLAWDDAQPVFVPFSNDVIHSRTMRPPIPPPIA